MDHAGSDRGLVTVQGNPGNKRAARVLRIQTPNERLKHGLVLLDTPGVGGLNANTRDFRCFGLSGV